jgi:hypothetical protein
MSTKLNMNHIVVGEDGRVAIGDEQLAAIENQNINPSAGGWDIYQDPWRNDFMCSGGGTDFFCISANPTNCNGESNVYTACPNGTSCRETVNSNSCVNSKDCTGSSNIGCPPNSGTRCGYNDGCV